MAGVMTQRLGVFSAASPPTATTRAYITYGSAGPVYVNTSFTTAAQYILPSAAYLNEK